MATRWVSEEVWRKAMAMKQEQISACERPGFILFHHGLLDSAYTQKYVAGLRRSLERIEAAGEPEWKERLSAHRT